MCKVSVVNSARSPLVRVGVGYSLFVSVCRRFLVFNTLVHLHSANKAVNIWPTVVKSEVLDAFFIRGFPFHVNKLLIVAFVDLFVVLVLLYFFFGRLDDLVVAHNLLLVLPNERQRERNQDQPENEPAPA